MQNIILPAAAVVIVIGISGCGGTEADKQTEKVASVAEPFAAVPHLGTVERLEHNVRDSVGTSNRGAERVTVSIPEAGIVEVVVALNKNLTGSMVKKGMRRDIVAILQAVAESGYDVTVVGITGTYPLGSEDENVVLAVVESDRLDDIDWATFDVDDIKSVAARWWVHPQMK